MALAIALVEKEGAHKGVALERARVNKVVRTVISHVAQDHAPRKGRSVRPRQKAARDTEQRERNSRRWQNWKHEAQVVVWVLVVAAVREKV